MQTLTCQFDYATQWLARYQRNNKSNQLKNLRCWPICPPESGHKKNGFCGSPIRITLTLTNAISKTSDQITINDIQTFGEIRPVQPQHERFTIGDTFDAPLSNIGTVEEEDVVLMSPWKEESLTAYSHSFAFFPQRKGWHYGWRGSKHTADIEHAFYVYVTVPIATTAISSSSIHSSSRRRCVIAIFKSPRFRLFCRRRHQTVSESEKTELADTVPSSEYLISVDVASIRARNTRHVDVLLPIEPITSGGGGSQSNSPTPQSSPAPKVKRLRKPGNSTSASTPPSQTTLPSPNSSASTSTPGTRNVVRKKRSLNTTSTNNPQTSTVSSSILSLSSLLPNNNNNNTITSTVPTTTTKTTTNSTKLIPRKRRKLAVESSSTIKQAEVLRFGDVLDVDEKLLRILAAIGHLEQLKKRLMAVKPSSSGDPVDHSLPVLVPSSSTTFPPLPFNTITEDFKQQQYPPDPAFSWLDALATPINDAMFDAVFDNADDIFDFTSSSESTRTLSLSPLLPISPMIASDLSVVGPSIRPHHHHQQQQSTTIIPNTIPSPRRQQQHGSASLGRTMSTWERRAEAVEVVEALARYLVEEESFTAAIQQHVKASSYSAFLVLVKQHIESFLRSSFAGRITIDSLDALLRGVKEDVSSTMAGTSSSSSSSVMMSSTLTVSSSLSSSPSNIPIFLHQELSASTAPQQLRTAFDTLVTAAIMREAHESKASPTASTTTTTTTIPSASQISLSEPILPEGITEQDLIRPRPLQADLRDPPVAGMFDRPDDAQQQLERMRERRGLEWVERRLLGRMEKTFEVVQDTAGKITIRLSPKLLSAGVFTIPLDGEERSFDLISPLGPGASPLARSMCAWNVDGKVICFRATYSDSERLTRAMWKVGENLHGMHFYESKESNGSLSSSSSSSSSNNNEQNNDGWKVVHVTRQVCTPTVIHRDL